MSGKRAGRWEMYTHTCVYILFRLFQVIFSPSPLPLFSAQSPSLFSVPSVFVDIHQHLRRPHHTYPDVQLNLRLLLTIRISSNGVLWFSVRPYFTFVVVVLLWRSSVAILRTVSPLERAGIVFFLASHLADVLTVQQHNWSTRVSHGPASVVLNSVSRSNKLY